MQTASADIAFVQLKENAETFNNNNVATGTFTATTGNFIVCRYFYNSNSQSVQSITDTSNNTYLPGVGPTTGTGSTAGWRAEVWYAYNITGHASLNITTTFTGSFNAEKAVSCHEYSGIQTSADPKDTTSALASNVCPATTTAITTSQNNELVFTSGFFSGAGTLGKATVRSTLNSNPTGEIIAAFPGTYDATYACAGNTYILHMIAFKGKPVAKKVQGGFAVSPGTSTTSLSKAFPNNNTAGNFIWVGFYYGGTGRTLTVTDTAGNTYNLADTATQVTDGHQIWIYYAMNIAGGANTVTATASGAASTFRGLHVVEYSGIAKSSALDKTSTGTANASSAISSGATASTVNASELLTGFFGLSGSSNYITPTNSFFMLFNNIYSGNLQSFSVDRLVSSTGAYTATGTANANNNWSAIIATFKTINLPIKHKVIQD